MDIQFFLRPIFFNCTKKYKERIMCSCIFFIVPCVQCLIGIDIFIVRYHVALSRCFLHTFYAYNRLHAIIYMHVYCPFHS